MLNVAKWLIKEINQHSRRQRHICFDDHQTLLVGSICNLPAVISHSHCANGVRCSAVSTSLWQAWWPETHYPTICEILHIPSTVAVALQKLSFTRFINVHSALEAL